MATIEVTNDDWGEGLVSDIQRLLVNVSHHFDQHLLQPVPQGHLLIRRRFGGVPQINYRDSDADPHTVLLSAHDRLWSKYSYQFAHEYFHFLSDYQRLRNNKHKWFEEILGEVASIFAVRRMGRSWQDFPPYPNWRDYATQLTEYSDEICSREAHQIPGDGSLCEWFRLHETALLNNPYDRALNGTFAVQMVSIFDRDPHYWELVRYIPEGRGSFRDFLVEWVVTAPEHLRPGIDAIATLFGYSDRSAETSEAEQHGGGQAATRSESA